MFIVFEGIDGCGKTTVMSSVAVALKNSGYNVLISRESSNIFGQMAKYGKHKFDYPEFNNMDGIDSLFLWLMARKYALKEIDQFNGVVLQDRYYDSTMVYQELTHTSAEELCYDPMFFKTPDLTFIFDVDPENAIKRCNGNRCDLFETDQFAVLEKRRAEYLSLPERQQWRKFKVINTIDVDPEYIIGQCIAIIMKLSGGL